MRSTLSVLGLYQYDATIFDNMSLPSNTDKETVINNILMECAELEIIYPDPDFLKLALGVWSKKELPVWEELEKTLHYDYNPIENYNRTETWTDKGSGKRNSTANANSSNEGNGEIENTVSAYNESTYQPRDKSTNTNKNANTMTGTQADESNSQNEHVGQVQGNIGVTTTQKLIKEQRDVVKFNIIDYIIESFKHRFCLMIY